MANKIDLNYELFMENVRFKDVQEDIVDVGIMSSKKVTNICEEHEEDRDRLNSFLEELKKQGVSNQNEFIKIVLKKNSTLLNSIQGIKMKTVPRSKAIFPKGDHRRLSSSNSSEPLSPTEKEASRRS